MRPEEKEKQERKFFCLKRLFSRKRVVESGKERTQRDPDEAKKQRLPSGENQNSSRKAPKSQTKILQKRREKIFNPARDFFISHAKIKTFSDHVFLNQIIHLLQTKRENDRIIGRMKTRQSAGANQPKRNIKQTLPEKNAKFVVLHKIIALET